MNTSTAHSPSSAGGARAGAATGRCALVWLAVTGLLTLVVQVLLLPALRPALAAAASGELGEQTFAALLVQASAPAGLLAACWAFVATTAVTAAATRGRSVGAVPTPVRRALLLACGVALSGSVGVPALAAPVQPAGEGPRSTPAATAGLDGLPLPDRADSARLAPGAPAPGAAPAPRHGPGPVIARPGPALRAAHTVVVRPGDSLWSLAGADGWRRLYRANAAVIGADPDLIHPGQELRLPPEP